MSSDQPPEQQAADLTFAEMGLQAAVLAYVIDSSPNPVPLEELPVLLFEGRFTAEEEAQTLRAARWLVGVQLLQLEDNALSPASPPTGLARASLIEGEG